MVGFSYRITSPTFAMFCRDGNRGTLIVPVGAVVLLIDGPLDGNRLVDVEWNGESLMMFTLDLRERAELV